MIKIENIETYGWEAALRGMRNPMNSWAKADSVFCDPEGCGACQYMATCKGYDGFEDPEQDFYVGPNDMGLMRSLFRAGTEHRKYMRQIMISMDVTAPLYWWKEFDTYKIGTTANSCSTMHKIHAKPFGVSDFSFEHWVMDESYIIDLVHRLEELRKEYLKTKDKNVWYSIIQLLPTSYNQMRTITMNYEVAYRMIEQRQHHKLDEWHIMTDKLRDLPYMADIIAGTKVNE